MFPLIKSSTGCNTVGVPQYDLILRVHARDEDSRSISWRFLPRLHFFFFGGGGSNSFLVTDIKSSSCLLY